jgi:hypothetical protein
MVIDVAAVFTFPMVAVFQNVLLSVIPNCPIINLEVAHEPKTTTCSWFFEKIQKCNLIFFLNLKLNPCVDNVVFYSLRSEKIAAEQAMASV